MSEIFIFVIGITGRKNYIKPRLNSGINFTDLLAPFSFTKKITPNFTSKHNQIICQILMLRVYTSDFRMHLPHCVAIFYYLLWFKVRTKKSQCNVENACGNRMCKQRLKSTSSKAAHDKVMKLRPRLLNP
jgi:hypothetical protein